MSKFHMENVFIMDSYVLDMILNFFWRYLDRKVKIVPKPQPDSVLAT